MAGALVVVFEADGSVSRLDLLSPVAGQALEEDALTAAVIAAIRHRHTNYDELFMTGCDRAEVRDEVDRVLDRWRHPPGQC
ncbi:MAG TPA: DUF2293 domain-containing protein [Terriglobia bacterium]|nr:DUF2293 domain-containing protein [Terriglobia bacterium]